jgi:putative FmdB family regulatory protein
MPIYEYECSACKTRFERSQRFSDAPVTECPECGGPVRRLLFPAGVVFKGSGWYITDSRKPAPSESSASASGGKSDAKGETDKSSDGKSDGKTESASTPKTESKASAAAPAT